MIADNLLRVRERIAAVCLKAGRSPDAVTLITVTKNRSIGEIKEIISQGVIDIGENRIQEALLKYNAFKDRQALKWHMVGHLQTNKVKDALKIFDLIHSVDSFRLAGEIDKQAAKISKVQDCLIEVKTSPEATKFGVNPEETLEFIKQIAQFKNIRVKGLMTIAPLVDMPELVRPYFRQLRELRDEINGELLLSMGMSDDFEVAIEEGANIIRLGRVIFA
ncbi:MAG: YggS family pyridoxal phosphate-dependent enzyme [Candidatus Omnitrophica bacterium]|nr:YggS family pyridoxal phosphate-dependent enzyme [Candidatus Omnitrophota bacterium]